MGQETLRIRTMSCLLRAPRRVLVLTAVLALGVARWSRQSLGFAAQRVLRPVSQTRGQLRGARRLWSSSAEAPAAPESASRFAYLAAGLAACSAASRRGWRLALWAAKGGVSVSTKKKKEKAPIYQTPEEIDWSQVSTEWEVDCFSRPVMQDGKKMWELMLTDANAQYRRVAQMKPTRVNSVVVQKLITIFIEESKVKPRVIRFYRKVMKNMLTVALNTMKDKSDKMENLKIVPSRNCHMLRTWLAWREREIYPKMGGYIKTPAGRKANSVQASMVQMSSEPIPERLRISRYAISAIPLGALARMKPGQLPGNLCRIPPGFSDNAMVHGIVVLTTREQVMISMLKTMEMCAMRVNLDNNELLLDLGIDKTYLVNKVPVEDREGCLQFERAKRELAGLHFVAIHNPVTGGQPNLPIEADDMGEEGCISGLWLCIDYSPVETQ